MLPTGNALFGTTHALPILKARDGVPNWASVAALVDEWQPDLLVVGEPLNMDGSVSELSEKAHKFGRRLGRAAEFAGANGGRALKQL